MIKSTQIIYIDMDGVITEYDKAISEHIKVNPLIQKPQATYNFFTNLEPIDGAIDAVNYLRNDSRFDVYILTCPSIKNPLCYTEKRVWTEKYFDLAFCKKLIISPNKSLLRGDFLIDDNIVGKGQECFEGQLLHFGSDKFPDWYSILKVFYD